MTRGFMGTKEEVRVFYGCVFRVRFGGFQHSGLISCKPASLKQKRLFSRGLESWKQVFCGIPYAYSPKASHTSSLAFRLLYLKPPENMRIQNKNSTKTRGYAGSRVPRPSIYPLLDPKYPFLGTIYPDLRFQGGSWYSQRAQYSLNKEYSLNLP